MSLFPGICGGSRAMMHWFESRIETAVDLDVRIDGARRPLAQMEVDTWGVELREIKGERYVALPFGTLDNPRGNTGGTPSRSKPCRCRSGG